MQKSEENGRGSPAVIWGGGSIPDRGHIQFEMPVVHSGKDVELRTGNTSRKFIEVWADVLKTVKVDEITLGVSINGEEERSFHRSFQDLRHHNVKRSGR